MPKIKDDDAERLIEKHAILDAIFSTKLWNAKYLKNRFAYIDRAENITPELKNNYRGMFFKYYSKYYHEIFRILGPLFVMANEESIKDNNTKAKDLKANDSKTKDSDTKDSDFKDSDSEDSGDSNSDDSDSTQK